MSPLKSPNVMFFMKKQFFNFKNGIGVFFMINVISFLRKVECTF